MLSRCWDHKLALLTPGRIVSRDWRRKGPRVWAEISCRSDGGEWGRKGCDGGKFWVERVDWNCEELGSIWVRSKDIVLCTVAWFECCNTKQCNWPVRPG